MPESQQPKSSPSGLLPAAGNVIGGYVVLGEVGHGGMSVIFAVRRAGPGGFGKLMALKMLLPHLATDAEFAATMLDEARITASIVHPNVVEVFDVGYFGSQPYIVMEFLQGRSLASVMKKGRLSLAGVLRILVKTVEGLAAAHATRGLDGVALEVAHRDVSPQNVHVGYNGIVKLVDFGVASALGRLAHTRSDAIKGKVAYLAPEQILRNIEEIQRVDVWAFGVVAWEALAQRRLFKAQDDGATLWSVLHADIPNLASVAPKVPGSISKLVMSCLQREPAARPHAAALAAGLAAAAHSTGTWQSSAALTTELQQMFEVERAVEQERLRMALRAEPSPLREDETGSSISEPFSQPVAPPTPKRAAHLALGLFAVLLGLAVVFAGRLVIGTERAPVFTGVFAPAGLSVQHAASLCRRPSALPLTPLDALPVEPTAHPKSIVVGPAHAPKRANPGPTPLRSSPYVKGNPSARAGSFRRLP